VSKDTLDCGGRIVNCVAFTPDGKWLVGGGGRFAGPPAGVMVWEASSGKLRYQKDLEADTASALAVFPDGKSVAWSSWYDDEVRLWALPGLKPIKTLPLILPDSPQPRYGIRQTTTVVGKFALSPDGRLLAAGCWDLKAKVWDVGGGTLRELAPIFKDNVDFVAFTDDGRTLVSGTAGVLAWWSVSTGEQIVRTALRGQPAWTHAITPDGRRLASVGWNGAIRIWDLSDRSCEQFSVRFKRQVAALAFSPDGSQLAIALEDKRVLFWDVAEKKVGERLPLENPPKAIAFSPDGRLLAVVEIPRATVAAPRPPSLVRLQAAPTRS